MNNFKTKKQKEFEKDKYTTILLFSLYMLSVLLASFYIGNFKTSGYALGILLGTTIAMIYFLPNIRKKDKKSLIAVAVIFAIYPIVGCYNSFKIFIIATNCLFAIRFNLFITKTYLSKRN